MSMSAAVFTGNHRMDERSAQVMLYSAISQFREALKDAASMTSARHDELARLQIAFDHFVHDEVPSRDAWDAAL